MINWKILLYNIIVGTDQGNILNFAPTTCRFYLFFIFVLRDEMQCNIAIMQTFNTEALL